MQERKRLGKRIVSLSAGVWMEEIETRYINGFRKASG